ncbi:MAG: endonuclease/exonuclease/phosphatase family protein [Planctomycetaceae bacterium]|nr:endonuclease/exonuclease/phosphatase family protein [Planctomycetaceae bacterium]
MTTFKAVFAALFAAAIGCGIAFADDAPKELRVLSYNIHIGIGNDKNLDLERTAKTILTQKPDLVAIQEIDRLTERTQNVDQVAELERLTGMHAVFGKTINIGSGEYGIAILSKYPITEHRITQLPRLDNQEDRGVLEATIQLDDKTTLLFACTHFCHINEERRIKQAEKINELLAQHDGLVILAGDFNAKPGSKTIEILKAKWSDATDEKPTFSSDNPRIKIDYIFYRPAEMVRVKETRVVEEPVASDHSPVLSVLEIAGSGK